MPQPQGQGSTETAARAAANPKIEVSGLTKVFGSDSTIEPLRMLREGRSKEDILRETGHVVGVADVSFTVNPGEVFVVMGLSGSGKSTLIRCLNRLIEPSDGSVLVDGEDIVAASPSRLREIRRTKMSMVFQHFGLLPHKTVLDNVAFGLKVQKVPERERLVQAARALELVGLKEWALQEPANLSGGMQQRVGLARALCTDPDILLMDEAFSALDPLIRRQMQDELMQLQKRLHKTIVFITHDLNEALRIGNTVVIMQDGEVVQAGTPTEIITNPATQYVADFIKDVDQGRVLQIDTVVREAVTVQSGRATAAEALGRLRTSDASGVYVVDAAGKPQGVATAADLAAERDSPITDVVHREFPHVSPDATLAETYAQAASGQPMAVIDQDGRLTGVVEPLDVLDALGRVEQIAEESDLRMRGTEPQNPEGAPR